jgi:hydroxypyruvate isomerase
MTTASRAEVRVTALPNSWEQKRSSVAAALRYQHATADRDRAIADALAGLAEGASVTKLATR